MICIENYSLTLFNNAFYELELTQLHLSISKCTLLKMLITHLYYFNNLYNKRVINNYTNNLYFSWERL